MTTKQQDAAAQQRGQGGATVAGRHGALAGKRQVGANHARPILGGSRAVCRVMVENLFGKRHWAAGWALDLCSADPQFLTHLAEQPRGYAHFLCLIRMALLEQGADDRNMQDDALLLRANSKKALLKTWLPSSPAGIVNLLPKLPNKPLQQDEYRWLIHALADKRIRKHLLHIKRIKKFDIFLANDVVNLPAQFRVAAMRFIKDKDDYEVLCRIMHAAKKLGLNVTEREIIQAADQQAGVNDGLYGWLINKISGLPFPPPPWEGDDKIRPVRSPDELKNAAEKFNNCLTHGDTQRRYASRVVAGFIYFYVCDHMPALIKVEREIFWGWRIDEMKGIKSRCLTLHQNHELSQRFLKAGISPERMHHRALF
ncbi:MAG: hypothetical protein OXU71_02040 [Gammaproteobacteria bacterium]|nr:hypothetical protein [Gammaproteobacteria bacterium]